MKEYTITKIRNVPDWSAIPRLSVSEILWLPDAGIRMDQQICYDETGLYIHQIATERHIRAELTDPLSPVCQDSCMEFFFRPQAHSRQYINFEWNLNGCLFLGLHGNDGTAMRLLPDDAVKTFSFQGNKTTEGWEIFYKIPWTFVRMFCPDLSLNAGTVIRANCYKCGDHTVNPHYLAWNPCTGEKPNFHQPDDFGRMVLK